MVFITKKEEKYREWEKGVKFRQLFPRWWREIWEYRSLILFSIGLLIIATILDYICGNYVTKVGSAESQDVFLKILPVVNLNFLFVYGVLTIISLLFLYPLFFKVKKLHETIAQFSFVVIMRSLFMSLTHLKLPADAIRPIFPNFLTKLVFENDLFFSGHVAVCFMGFLIFKESKIRYFFLAASIVMAITVLLMHLHYSIDVFAAFFITYGTYKIGQWLIKKMNNTKE